MEVYVPEKEKEEVIIEAAFQVFSQKGYYKAKVEEIAETAGVGKGTVYEYFSSKEEIFKKVMMFRLSRLIISIKEQLKDRSQVLEDFDKILGLYYNFARENIWMFYALVTEVGKLKPDLGKWMEAARKEIFQLIEEIIIEGKKQGIFREELDTRITVPFILGGIRVSVEVFFNMEEQEFNEQKWRKSVLDMILNGLGQ